MPKGNAEGSVAGATRALRRAIVLGLALGLPKGNAAGSTTGETRALRTSREVLALGLPKGNAEGSATEVDGLGQPTWTTCSAAAPSEEAFTESESASRTVSARAFAKARVMSEML